MSASCQLNNWPAGLASGLIGHGRGNIDGINSLPFARRLVRLTVLLRLPRRAAGRQEAPKRMQCKREKVVTKRNMLPPAKCSFISATPTEGGMVIWNV